MDKGTFAQSENQTPPRPPLSSFIHVENQRLLNGLGWEDHSSPFCGEFPDCA